jgi:indolepyruvate ferredoxin oxidoreductase beta subunit
LITNIVIAGLGGQGVISASDILATAAMIQGLDVKKSELHGLAMRGGYVASDVRYGDHVDSPMVPPGEADFVVVLEDSQVEAAQVRLKPNGILLKAGHIDKRALPSKKALNVAMLGALSPFLDLEEATWAEALRVTMPPKLHAPNDQAFALGREVGQALASSSQADSA